MTNLFSQNIKVHKTRVVSKSSSAKAGDVIFTGETIDGQMVIRVACGEGAVELLEVQPDSRGRMSTAEFIRGNRIQVQPTEKV